MRAEPGLGSGAIIVQRDADYEARDGGDALDGESTCCRLAGLRVPYANELSQVGVKRLINFGKVSK